MAFPIISASVFLWILSLCIARNPSCNSRWMLVYSHDNAGAIVEGDKGELIQAALGGVPVRVCYPESTYCTSLQYLHTINNHLCGQANLHISKINNGTFKVFRKEAYWWFNYVCTTGDYHMARYNLGEHVSRPDTVTSAPFSWFVRYSSCPMKAKFSTTFDGTIVIGSLSNLVKAVANGADIRLVDRFAGSAFALDNAGHDISTTVVSGQAIWEVSPERFDNHFGFQFNAHWVFKTFSSEAKEERLLWKVGDHVSKGNITRSAAVDWYIDDCWKLIYSHDYEGTPVIGSRDTLIDLVENGQRVKVVFSGFSVEPDTVYVRGGHVHAQILSNLGRRSDNFASIDPDTHWDWKMVDTQGRLHTVKYKIGDSVEHSKPTDKRAFMSWFVDDRLWLKVYKTSSNGVATYGAIDILLHAVAGGAEVRVQQDYPNSDATKFFTADNVDFYVKHINAMHVREVSIQGDMKFTDNPHWCFSLVDTRGMVDIAHWTVGRNEYLGHDYHRASGVTWFVNE